MKLLRYGLPGEEQPGLLDPNGEIRSLVGIVDDISGRALSAEGFARLQNIDVRSLSKVDSSVRLGPCVGSTSKVIGVAQNYRCFVSHAGLEEPKQPLLFMKPSSSICGPTDDILLPDGADKADWELEIGAVIGETARNVPIEEAMRYVSGFCILNDITERGRFARSGQFLNGKSADTFTPIGPYLVTKDEIPNYKALAISFELNGEKYQDGTAEEMIFDIEFLVSHISALMTLLPGDILATGTPKGVGARSTPPRFLRPGDRIRGRIDQLGQQEATVA